MSLVVFFTFSRGENVRNMWLFDLFLGFGGIRINLECFLCFDGLTVWFGFSFVFFVYGKSRQRNDPLLVYSCCCNAVVTSIHTNHS